MPGRRWCLAALAPVVVACSAIVAPEDLPIRCAEEDACPQGMRCKDDVCVAHDGGNNGCTPNDGPELCNGLDDDCDGDVDEGHDADEDGVTWCNGGLMEGRDCNDQDPEETPGKTEVCDGRDNDCDGHRDDDVCPVSQVCAPATGKCETRDCRVEGCGPGFECQQETGGYGCTPSANPEDCRNGTLACERDEICNPQDGRCVLGQPLDTSCSADFECADQLCVAPASLRMADGDSFCSTPCCGTRDCPDDFVCWQPGGGFSACVSRERLGLGNGQAAPDAGCATDSDCGSGSCVDGTCVEPCCDDGDCGAAECVVSLGVDEAGTDEAKLLCARGGLLPTGMLCDEASQCGSLFCVDTGYCTAPCCTSSACGEGLVCAYATLSDLSTAPMEHLCIADIGWAGPLHGDRAAGEDCLDGSDCRSDRCEAGLCVDACCSDSDCPAGTACRLSAVRGGGELVCRPDGR